MSHEYSEDRLVQKTTAEFFRDELGWDMAYAFDREDFGSNSMLGRASEAEVVLTRDLRQALARLNPGLPDEAYQKAVDEITAVSASKSLVQINREMYGLLRDGVSVTYQQETARGERRTTKTLRVVDFDHPENNRFLVVRELWVRGPIYRRRPDIVGFVNGLPLLFVELKRSTKDVRVAFEQNFTDYKDTVPHVFHHNALVMLSNGITGKVGSITSRYEHFNEWKRLDEDEEGNVGFETMLRGMCRKENFLDLVENFILFDDSAPGGTIKILARNHQYLGVNRAFEAVQGRDVRRGRLGVFWHTQGSGKSYSMAMLTRKVHRKVSKKFTFVVVTDRTELDDQIAKTFAGVGAITDVPGHQADSGEHLRALVAEGKSHVFTLIHKFNRADEAPYSARPDIIVIADEAHRTQYGRLAENMRRVLPKASFIAFTGTPLIESEGDQLTRKVFGDYVSTYDFKRAVEDGSTVPLFYDNRGEKLGITTPELNDRIADVLKEHELEQDQEEKLKRELAREYPILTAPERLDRIAHDIVAHFSERWLTGKAMLVCLDKITCVKMYELLSRHWAGSVARQQKAVAAAPDEQAMIEEQHKLAWLEETEIRVIVSEEQNEVKKFRDWRDVENVLLAERNHDWRWELKIERHRAVMKSHDSEEEFKDEHHPFRLAIVCAMWLTGFDVPSLATLYLDKPMKGHTLMQAIARANRVHEGKNNGLLVDYNGMLKSLRQALAKYGEGEPDGNDDGDRDPNVEALAEEYEQAVAACVDHVAECGFDLQKLVDAKGFAKLGLLDRDNKASAVNAVCLNDETRAKFGVLARDVFKKRKAVLGRSDLLEPHRDRYAAIEAIYDQLQENRESADITSIIVQLYGVVGEAIEHVERREAGTDTGKVFDISRIDFDRLKREFGGSGVKHTVVQNLKDALERKLRRMLERNPLRTDFYSRYQQIIEEYNKETDRTTIEQTFELLVDLVKDLDHEDQRAVREGLTEENLAVFDLLCQKKDGLDTRSRERVKRVAQELLERVKAELAKFDDWRAKEQTRAQVRVVIYDYLYDEGTGLPDGYAPDEVERLSTVIFQHVFTQYRSATEHPYRDAA